MMPASCWHIPQYMWLRHNPDTTLLSRLLTHARANRYSLIMTPFMKWTFFLLLPLTSVQLAIGAPMVFDQSPSADQMAKMIPNYQQWEDTFLKAAQACGLPPKPEWLRDRLHWYWKDAIMYRLGIEWKSFAGNMLHNKQARQDVNFKNDAEKKAKVKLLKAGVWEYADSPPSTNQGISQCWVKHRAMKTDVSKSMTSVAVETRTMSYEVDQWFQYTWDDASKSWVAYTQAQRQEVQADAEREYEKKVRAKIAELRASSAKGPKKNYVDSTRHAAASYNKLAQQAAAETDLKKKAELEQRLPFEWKGAFGSLCEAYGDGVQAAALEVHLKEFRTIPWN